MDNRIVHKFGAKQKKIKPCIRILAMERVNGQETMKKSDYNKL